MGFILSVVISLFISLSWALYASKLGGEEFRNALLWGQSANRVISGMSHARDWWWYISILPIIFFPWIFMPIIWKSLFKSKNYLDEGFRFCGFIIIFSIILLSIFADKQPHYLVPILPIISIFISYLCYDNLNIKLNRFNYIPLLIIILIYISIIYIIFNNEYTNIEYELKTSEIFLIIFLPIISLLSFIIIILNK